MIIAIDPGARHAGWSAWKTTGLFRCGLFRSFQKNVESAALDLADQARTIVAMYGRPVLLIIEQMQVYAGEKSKGDPADLIACAFVGGTLAGAIPSQALWWPRPTQWKGQVPKDIAHARFREACTDRDNRVLSDALVRVPRSLQHNVLDAAALGRWGWQKLPKMLD